MDPSAPDNEANCDCGDGKDRDEDDKVSNFNLESGCFLLRARSKHGNGADHCVCAGVSDDCFAGAVYDHCGHESDVFRLGVGLVCA